MAIFRSDALPWRRTASLFFPPPTPQRRNTVPHLTRPDQKSTWNHIDDATQAHCEHPDSPPDQGPARQQHSSAMKRPNRWSEPPRMAPFIHQFSYKAGEPWHARPYDTRWLATKPSLQTTDPSVQYHSCTNYSAPTCMGGCAHKQPCTHRALSHSLFNFLPHSFRIFILGGVLIFLGV